MFQLNFNQPVHVHFIGIGGISMSGLAEILLDRGFTVSGSDMHESALTAHLQSLGARIDFPQRAENIVPGIELAVYTAAIHPDNPEYQAAVAAGIPMLSRADLLGSLMKNYRQAINVAGTHGKTTTTSMLASVLLAARLDPTVSVGGMLPQIGGNIRVGQSEYFLAEACEYTNSFLSFFPTISIILNVEADHMDFFKDITQIRASFRKFAEKLPADGLLVINSEIPKLRYFTEGLACPCLSFGRDLKADYSANFIRYDRMARPSFQLLERGEALAEIKLGVTGEHNVYNALSVIAVCRHLGIPMEAIKQGLEQFCGTDRRFQRKGERNGFVIIDDYAHHPQEIAATIEAARKYPHRRLWVVFQPHTYSRTAAFLDDFAGALATADEIILADIYAAREQNTIGISSEDLKAHMLEQNTNVHYIPDFEEIERYILAHVQPGDLLITMGAGDIVRVGEALLE